MSGSADHNKRVVSLPVQAIGRGDLRVFDELCTARAAPRAGEWAGPFLKSFPDVIMDIVRMISDGDTVVGAVPGNPSPYLARALPPGNVEHMAAAGLVAFAATFKEGTTGMHRAATSRAAARYAE